MTIHIPTEVLTFVLGFIVCVAILLIIGKATYDD